MELKCFTCGRSFNGDTNKLLSHYKMMFDKFGIERYFFRLKANSPILVVKKEEFSRIFKDKIKPNLKKKNAPEYAHISEFNPEP